MRAKTFFGTHLYRSILLMSALYVSTLVGRSVVAFFTPLESMPDVNVASLSDLQVAIMFAEILAIIVGVLALLRWQFGRWVFLVCAAILALSLSGEKEFATAGYWLDLLGRFGWMAIGAILALSFMHHRPRKGH